MSQGFAGVFPAIITPMDRNGRFDEAAFREVMEFNIEAGVHGFWIAGGTGESIFLDDDENRRIGEAAVDQARGRVKTIMHVGAATTARAAALAEYAAAVGVDAICCVPPFFYQCGDGVVEHFRTVSKAADLPFFVYNLPHCTGVEITPGLMARIQERVARLAGLKHSAPNFGDINAFNKMGLLCFTGSSRLMLPALTIGACGCVDGPPNMAPELFVAIWNAWREGDLKRAEAAQGRATQAGSIVVVPGGKYHAAVKAVVGFRLGIDCGDPRSPLPALTPAEREELRERAAAFGLCREP